MRGFSLGHSSKWHVKPDLVLFFLKPSTLDHLHDTPYLNYRFGLLSVHDPMRWLSSIPRFFRLFPYNSILLFSRSFHLDSHPSLTIVVAKPSFSLARSRIGSVWLFMVHFHRRECPAITYMAMGFQPRSFPVGGMYVKGIGQLTKV